MTVINRIMGKYVSFAKVYHAMNELFSSGYTTSESPEKTGFSYAVMPLQFNLQQGCKTPPDRHYFKYYVGQRIKGICPYNEKEYTGLIKHIYYTSEENEDPEPTLIYIQDDKTNQIIPIQVDSNLRHIK